MTLRSPLQLLRDVCGTMAIETAVVAPVLAVMAIGVFEVGTLVSRQQELQSSASEAEGIILAAAAGAGTDSAKIEQVIEHSLNLDPDQVSLEQRFRCDTAETMTDDSTTCDTERPIYRYVVLHVTDTYAPVWTWFGMEPHTYDVERTVQVQ
ncbi:pilus assembly protein [Altererythrobacter soli]|uniref:Pilus assembly protein n=1 Tax=Croceibacterium soli TaxID=1739690 RepID=A0A6I4UTT6_9SPHN|nr:TadE family protein [Croceibacterium soli]MXP42322.1 pilus assembly protein [Croceibacterium soli]